MDVEKLLSKTVNTLSLYTILKLVIYYIDKKAVSNGEFVLKKDDNGDVYISKT